MGEAVMNLTERAMQIVRFRWWHAEVRKILGVKK